MRIECDAKVKIDKQPSVPVTMIDRVSITLEGDFEAIMELLRQIDFDYLKAQALGLV